MPTPNPIREAALLLVEKLVSVQPKFDTLEKLAHEVFGDFSPRFTPVAEAVYGEMRALILAAVGDDIVDYFLDECQMMHGGGYIQELDGKKWPLETMADLRAYLAREDV